jgi:hypothetical protein
MPEIPPAEGESLARLSHLEPLLAGQRVLVLCAPGTVRACQAWLAERRLAGALATADDAGLAPHFDRIVVQPGEGRPLGAARLGRLRALLAPGGLLAVSAGPDEAGVETLLREAFPVVETASVVPLAGFAVVPPSGPAAGMTWDGSGLEAPRPSSRLFLCGVAPSGLAGATLVALPLAGAQAPGLADGAAAQLAMAREEELSAEVLALSWRADALRRELAGAVAERDALRARVAREAGPADTAGLPDLLP